MPVNTHADRVSITVNLDGPVAQEAGFYVLYLVPLAANSLNSAAYITYTAYSDAVADQAAGYISATTLAALADVFSQARVPSSIHVASVDLVGGDTYVTAISDMLAEGLDFYAICVQDRTDAVIAAVAAAVEALSNPLLFFCQSDDADWKTSGLPAGLSALSGLEKTVSVYHSSDSEFNDLCWAANRLAFSPDDASVPWNCPLAVVAANSTITSAERAFLRANYGNHGARLNGTYTFYMDPGYTMAGRQIAERVSADWYAIRVDERVTQLMGDLTARGQKLPVSQTGVRQVEAIMRQTYEQGVQAGHFEPDQFRFSSATINSDGTTNSADISAQRIRATATIQLTTGAIQVSMTANLSRTAANN